MPIVPRPTVYILGNEEENAVFKNILSEVYPNAADGSLIAGELKVKPKAKEIKATSLYSPPDVLEREAAHRDARAIKMIDLASADKVDYDELLSVIRDAVKDRSGVLKIMDMIEGKNTEVPAIVVPDKAKPHLIMALRIAVAGMGLAEVIPGRHNIVAQYDP
ncbi:MAG: hypothetical protein HQL29_00090 [Candidatus Omnitrophica bacterium]|nr:hypothetical protein [Candidatus Omnitrophota bacterium]